MISKLKYGDTIGFFSPSAPITAHCPKRFSRAKAFLEGKGFKLEAGKLTGFKDAYRSGSIQERAEELNALIRNPEVRCIISTIGGMNSNSLLPYIDYEAFKKDPKIIIGYSDVTALLFGIYAKTGIQTFYGPALVASFGEMEPFNEMTYKYFEDLLVEKGNGPLFGDNLPYHYEMPKVWTDEFIDWESQDRVKEARENQWLTRKGGVVSGRLIIGNLNTMDGIWGSDYMPQIQKGDILFIEDSLKNAATVERSFAKLKLNGIFDRIGGLILGKHELFDAQGSGKASYEILEEVLGDYNFPFLADVDCSHTHPMFTMPIGGFIELNADEKTLTLMDPSTNYFDKAALTWDNPERTERARQVAKTIEEELKLDGNQALTAMEFGCGTGLVSYFLKDQFKKITLIDESSGMIQVLSDKVEKEQLSHFEPIALNLLTDENYQDAFDVIYTSMALHHIEELEAILTRLKTHLKPGGRICIVDLDKDNGDFHATELDFHGHHGFDQEQLKNQMKALSYRELKSYTFFKGKKIKNEKESSYSLFILSGTC